MSRSGAHRIGPALLARAIELMKRLRQNAEFIRIAPDVVERQEPVVDVEGGILETFGHQGRGQLLKSHHEMKPALLLLFGKMIAELKQEKTGYEIDFEKQAGIGLPGLIDALLQQRTILFGETLFADIAPVHRKK